MTCCRRLHEWMQAGVRQRVHEAVLRRLREHDQITWYRASVDAASVPAPAGGEHTGRNPTDRGKLGCKHHFLVDQRGLPLVARIPGAQVQDSRLLIPLVESIPAVKGLSGRARKRTGKLHADRAYASRAHRAAKNYLPNDLPARPETKKASSKAGPSLNSLVGARGFEPPTTCTPCTYATRLRYAPTRATIITEARKMTSLFVTKHLAITSSPPATPAPPRTVPRA